jgi:hypothetical protein
MCKVNVEYKTIIDYWLKYLSQLQSLEMAQNDLAEMEKGYKLYYVLDGYDFNEWFSLPEKQTKPNRYGPLIRKSWNDYFRLADAEKTCAILSPFTVIQFLIRTNKVLGDKPSQFQRHPEIVEVLEEVQLGKKQFSEIPAKQQEIIRNLIAEIIDLKNISDLFESGTSAQSSSFQQLKDLMEKGKIRKFAPPIPGAAQSMELLGYDEGTIQESIVYLYEKRTKKNYSNRPDIFNREVYMESSLDTYHYVLIHNSCNPWMSSGIIPNLTSSGRLTRNSWYRLAYNKPPAYYGLKIPQGWNVRSGDEPALLFSVLDYYKDHEPAMDFLIQAHSMAQEIVDDLYKIPQLRINRQADIDQLKSVNPDIEVSSETVTLIRRYDEKYNPKLSLSSLGTSASEKATPQESYESIDKQDLEMLQAFIKEPAKYREIMESASTQAANEIKKLDLVDPDMRSYLAPMGEGIDDLIDSINDGLGISLK